MQWLKWSLEGLCQSAYLLLHLPANAISDLRNHRPHTHAQARQRHLRMLSLLCYASGPVAEGEPGFTSLVKLMVQVQHSATFLDDAAVRKQQEALYTRCKSVMAARAGECWSVLLTSKTDSRIKHMQVGLYVLLAFILRGIAVSLRLTLCDMFLPHASCL